MRVAKLVDIGRFEVVCEQTRLVAEASEAVVDVRYVGICGTDIHIFDKGRRDVTLPRVMGHELSGIVVEAGKDVSNVKPGDRVVFDPVMSCGNCALCRKGHPNVCSQVKCFGVQMDGGFQDYIKVPAKQLYLIPEDTPLDQAALAEPFSIAANILSRANVQKGESVIVNGAGTIGLCIVQATKGIGARVLVSDVVSQKLEIARNFGCDYAVDAKSTSLAEQVACFAPDEPDVIIDAVGFSDTTQECLSLTCPTTRLVVISFDAKPLSIPPVDVTKKELAIIGSRMNALQFPRVMKWMADKAIRPAEMISCVYPVERIQEAFESALADKTRMKTLIYFGKDGKE